MVIFPPERAEANYLSLTNVAQAAHTSYTVFIPLASTLSNSRKDANIYSLTNVAQAAHTFYTVLISLASTLSNSGKDANIYFLNGTQFNRSQVESRNQLPAKLKEIFSAMPKNYFFQEEAAFEAAYIFQSFGIENIIVQYTGDESVMFEFVQAGVYFLLELFNDGDIAYLLRKGREKPVAHDISQGDLYDTIESAYEATVAANVF